MVKFHRPNFNRFSTIHPSDRRTDDGQAIAYTRYSRYAVARKGKGKGKGKAWILDIALLTGG